MICLIHYNGTFRGRADLTGGEIARLTSKGYIITTTKEHR